MLTYGFYNAINGDRTYNAVQFSAIFDGIINDGVFMTVGQAFLVEPHVGMAVKIGTGRAWFNRTWTDNDSMLVLTLDPSEVVLGRIDAVILEVDTRLDKRVNSIKIIKGTPASYPQRPAMIRTEEQNQYPLAYISVPAVTSTITAGLITKMTGTVECPWVTGILETVNIQMLDEIEAYLAKIVEVTNERIDLIYDPTTKLLTNCVTRWEDNTTKKQEEIFTWTKDLVTMVTTHMYDEAGTLKKSYTDTVNYTNSVPTSLVRHIL